MVRGIQLLPSGNRHWTCQTHAPCSDTSEGVFCSAGLSTAAGNKRLTHLRQRTMSGDALCRPWAFHHFHGSKEKRKPSLSKAFGTPMNSISNCLKSMTSSFCVVLLCLVAVGWGATWARPFNMTMCCCF